MGLKVNPRFNEILADALERQKAEQEAEHIADVSKKDTISRQAAIDAAIEAADEWDGGLNVQRAHIIEDRLKVLPSIQSEQTDCEYCHEDRDGFIRPIEKNSHAFVSFGLDGWNIAMRANGWVGRAPIKFCPMCGRRLTDD